MKILKSNNSSTIYFFSHLHHYFIVDLLTPSGHSHWIFYILPLRVACLMESKAGCSLIRKTMVILIENAWKYTSK